MNNHGTIVYLTKCEEITLWGLRIGAVVIGICGGLLEISRGKESDDSA